MFHWPSIDLQTCMFGFIDRDFQGTSSEGEKLNIESSEIHSNNFKTFRINTFQFLQDVS